MSEGDRPRYCEQCGSLAEAGDRFCGVCGASITPNVPDASTREIPDQVQSPQGGIEDQGTPARNNRAFLVTGVVGVVFLLLVGVGALAFVGLGSGIRKSDSENANATTYVPDIDSTPSEAASPGGSGRIAYVAGDKESTDIFSSNPQGGNEVQITNNGVIYDFSYSPNGDKVAFIKDGDLYIAGTDGSGDMQLTEEEDYIASPAFSHDGQYIAFVVGGGTESEIYTVKADGSELNQLTDGPGQLEAKDAPAWNPQDMEIAFQATYDAGSNDDDTIYTVDFPDGDNLVQVTESDDPDNEYDPAYSPDGETIAYASDEETYYAGASDIYTVAADGSERGNAKRLTDSGRNLEPVFSPDGERIAYASTSSPLGYESYDIFTMDSESGDDKFNVTETSDRGESSPSWSKQSGELDNQGDDTSTDGSGGNEAVESITSESSSSSSATSIPEPSTSASPEPGSSDLNGQSNEEIESDAEEAAGEYYRAVGVMDWGYTYDHLDSSTRSEFTRNEWFQKNEYLAGDGSTIYYIDSVNRLSGYDEPTVGVVVILTFSDGSTTVRNTYFVYEDGSWKHRFGQEEYELLMPDLSYEEFVEAQG